MTYVLHTDNSRYTYINTNGIIRLLKNGRPWRDVSGDMAFLSLLNKTEELERENSALKLQLKGRNTQ